DRNRRRHVEGAALPRAPAVERGTGTMMHDSDDHLRPLVERLPRSIEPPRDLWPAIASRIAARTQRQRSQWMIGFAAAAVIAIAAASSVATAWLLRDGDRPGAVAAAPAAATGAREAAYLRA